MIEPNSTVLDFVAGKRAFYLDGKLYFFLEKGLKPAGVRGTVNVADYEIAESSLAIGDARGHTTLIPFNEPVQVEGDCAVWKENPSRVLSQNRLMRYAYDTRTNLDSYFAKRTRFGLVDYWLIEDNWGNQRPASEFKEFAELAPKTATVVPSALGPGKDALVLELYNDMSEAKVSTKLVPLPTTFTVSGRYLSFTTREKAEEGKAFV